MFLLTDLNSLKMKFLFALAIFVIVAEGVSFYDVVLEEWNTFKVSLFLIWFVYVLNDVIFK